MTPSPRDFDVSVTLPPSPRRYSGRRARRQAFYARQRDARSIRRAMALLVESAPASWQFSIERAQCDALIHGTGVVQIEGVEPRHDIDPPTGESWWLQARVKRVTIDEYRREFGGKWPDDFCPSDKP